MKIQNNKIHKNFKKMWSKEKKIAGKNVSKKEKMYKESTRYF